MKYAYFAGGCFWCIAPSMRRINGVRSVISGYCGGTEESPRYEEVKLQKTSHRETVRLEYDETIVSYSELIDFFLGSIDPFDGGGQFIDRGHSYTLAVYPSDEAEASICEEQIRKLSEKTGRSVFISVEPFLRFWPAEEYHQDYDLKNPEKFRKELEKSGRSVFFSDQLQDN